MIDKLLIFFFLVSRIRMMELIKDKLEREEKNQLAELIYQNKRFGSIVFSHRIETKQYSILDQSPEWRIFQSISILRFQIC